MTNLDMHANFWRARVLLLGLRQIFNIYILRKRRFWIKKDDFDIFNKVNCKKRVIYFA